MEIVFSQVNMLHRVVIHPYMFQFPPISYKGEGKPEQEYLLRLVCLERRASRQYLLRTLDVNRVSNFQ